MCGRYVQISTPEQLAATFDVDEVRTDPLPPRHNVAPSQDVYAVVERDGHRRLGTLRWGFVPHWAPSLRDTRQPINARLETVATSRMFADAFRRRRCLLPADGFYEWQAPPQAGGRKQPFHLHLGDGSPFAFGGIWTVWRDPDLADDVPDELARVASTAIVTTAASGALERIHHRAPLIVPRHLWDAWLTASDDEVGRLAAAVRDLAPPDLVADPVSTRVNDVRNDGPELLEPLDR